VTALIARASLQQRSIIPVAGRYMLLVAALISYLVVRKVVSLSAESPLLGLATVLFSIVCALPFRTLKYDEVPSFLGLFVRGIGLVVLIQVFFDAVNFTPGSPNILFGTGETAAFYRFAGLAALLAGAVGLWRPAFLVALFAYYEIFRTRVGLDAGIYIVQTDYKSMLDTGLFGAVGVLVAVAATSRWPLDGLARFQNSLFPINAPRLRIETCLLIWAAAIGAHLGNYFYSGLAKIEAGGSEPLTWLLHNVTQTSILIGLERGDNPFAEWPSVLQSIWNLFVNFQIPLNAMILGAQLLAPAAIVHRRVLLALTVFYDLFHIGVYLTLGALFLFWIVVNVLIFLTAQRLPFRNFTNEMRIVMLLTTIFGIRFFYTNELGWLDGAKIASPRFFAETRDGRSLPIPGPFFGIFAYNIAQGFLYVPDNVFPQRIGGNTFSLADWRDAQECGPKRLATQNTGVTLESVRNLVLSTDRFARNHPWYKKWNTYYYYPHHMVPNPLEFTAFNNVNMDDIVAYTYVIDSVCLNLKNGRLDRDVRDHWDYKIPVEIP
jgi:hypothetical protein